MNWDDLRVAIAVHKGGSYAAAAAALGIDETTVARRLSRLERDLGHALFQAVDGARTPTPAGQAVLGKAVRIQTVAGEIADIGEAVEQPSSTLRLATTDSIAVGLLAPNAARLLSAQPGLTLQLLASTENVNFSRWEADLALRLKQPERGDFVVSRIADLGFYFVEPTGQGPLPLLCAYPDELAGAPEAQYLAESRQRADRRLLTKNLIVMRSFIETGTGCGILPSFLCRQFLDNSAFTVSPLPVKRGVWLLLQPHLKHDPLARATVDWVKACFASASSL